MSKQQNFKLSPNPSITNIFKSKSTSKDNKNQNLTVGSLPVISKGLWSKSAKPNGSGTEYKQLEVLVFGVTFKISVHYNTVQLIKGMHGNTKKDWDLGATSSKFLTKTPSHENHDERT